MFGVSEPYFRKDDDCFISRNATSTFNCPDFGGNYTGQMNIRFPLMKQSKIPRNWDEKRVQQVIAHYVKQTEDEAADEDEAAPFR